jgi:hypothetical protein
MPRRSKSILARASKLRSESEPLRLTIEGNPEWRRLGIRMASDREAMVGGDYYVALDSESTKAFHARMKSIARARGGPPFAFVFLGHPSNIEPLQES